jgi:hypothetical protein
MIKATVLLTRRPDLMHEQFSQSKGSHLKIQVLHFES